MNYISDQSGIMNRYLREQENWKAHLENTKNYIAGFISRKGFKTISFLGSGWLLDVPLDFLMEHAEKVFLYDIFHPVQVRHKLRNDSKFKFVETDITGGLILETYDFYRKFKKDRKIPEMNKMNFYEFSPQIQTDCYVSLNILNQLDILIVDFLKKKGIGDETDYAVLRSEIQKVHIASLPKGKSCLIADYEEVITDKDQNTPLKKNLVFTPLPDGQNIQEWRWDFDLSGTYNIGRTTAFNVIAMEI